MLVTSKPDIMAPSPCKPPAPSDWWKLSLFWGFWNSIYIFIQLQKFSDSSLCQTEENFNQFDQILLYTIPIFVTIVEHCAVRSLPSGLFLGTDVRCCHLQVPFFSIDNGAELGSGLMCTRSTDAEVFQNRNLLPKYQQLLGPHFRQISVWGWGPDSGILPCPVYCRHCVLAVTAPGIPAAAGDSFLDETFLADRQTTLREYIASCPQLMDVQPPESLRGRYSG